MHILIIELVSTGHHLNYLAKILANYLALGHTVTLSTLKNTLENSVISSLEDKYKPHLKTIEIPFKDYQNALNSRLSDIGRELKIRKIFKDTYKIAKQTRSIDYVFLPYLDYCLYSIGLLGSPFKKTQWGDICMRPSFHYHDTGIIAPPPKAAAIKSFLFTQVLSSKTLKKIYTIDETLYKHIALRNPKYSPRIEYLPDPAELIGAHTSSSAREKLKIPSTATVVLVYGALNERKGIQSLIGSLNLGKTSNKVHLLLVGRQTETMKGIVQKEACDLKAQNRLHVIDRFVTDEDQQMVFAAADIIWLGYRDHFTMSGVLVLAAIAEKKIIGTEQGLIGWYIKEKGLGFCINTEDQSLISDSINLLATETNPVAMCPKSSHFLDNNWSFFLKSIKP